MNKQKLIQKISYIPALYSLIGLLVGFFVPFIGIIGPIMGLSMLRNANENEKQYIDKNQTIFVIAALVSLSLCVLVNVVNGLTTPPASSETSNLISEMLKLLLK